jgi:hypothetical protein
VAGSDGACPNCGAILDGPDSPRLYDAPATVLTVARHAAVRQRAAETRAHSVALRTLAREMQRERDERA